MDWSPQGREEPERIAKTPKTMFKKSSSILFYFFYKQYIMSNVCKNNINIVISRVKKKHDALSPSYWTHFLHMENKHVVLRHSFHKFTWYRPWCSNILHIKCMSLCVTSCELHLWAHSPPTCCGRDNMSFTVLWRFFGKGRLNCILKNK